MNKWVLSFLFIFIGFGFFCGCTPTDLESLSEPVITVEPIESAATQPAEVEVFPISTETTLLIPPMDFSSDTVFCANEPAGSPFTVTCSENGLSVFQSPGRRKTDSMLRREIPITSNGFTLSAEVISQPAQKNRLDQNQFGFYFTTKSGKSYAIRLEGQYFNFEEWNTSDKVELENSFNKTYAPALNSAGRKNNFRLVCKLEGCDLFGNDVLIGRSPFGTQDGIKTLGFFAASSWDQEFGTLLLENLSAAELSPNRPEMQSFILIDDLTRDNGTFSEMGLSGAFSDFEEDGFHFSPVIPYGYYAAKSGLSLADVSVRAFVNMEFNPNVKATQYAGVVCRSSLDGMYMAVLRADATYTIFRDTIQRPFALLAHDQIEGIQEGRSDNAICLDCIGDTISLYINDIQVESFEDNRYGIRFGRSGLFTKTGGAPYSDAIIFSNFSIEEIR
ncbi:MAG: hypothetical protein Q7J07_07110 [Pelolinea sp.]|nr:hypothetical protein [Pelolinea sp.]